jgi:hypothetical protein
MNGSYYGFKGYSVDHLPINKHFSPFYGDAFIAKITKEFALDGETVYVDVPEEFLRLNESWSILLRTITELPVRLDQTDLAGDSVSVRFMSTL